MTEISFFVTSQKKVRQVFLFSAGDLAITGFIWCKLRFVCCQTLRRNGQCFVTNAGIWQLDNKLKQPTKTLNSEGHYPLTINH